MHYVENLENLFIYSLIIVKLKKIKILTKNFDKNLIVLIKYFRKSDTKIIHAILYHC